MQGAAGGTAPDPIQAGELVSFKILKEASSAGDEESRLPSAHLLLRRLKRFGYTV